MRTALDHVHVVSDPVSGEWIEDGYVIFQDDSIIETGDGPLDSSTKALDAVIDGNKAFLLPGLADCHNHFYSTLTTGMPSPGVIPRNFPENLRHFWWKWDKALDPAGIELSALVGAIQALKSGVTTVFDHHSSPSSIPGSLDLIASVLERTGLRGAVAYEVSDRNGLESFREGIEENRRAIERYGEHPSIRGLFGLHAVFSLSDESLRICAEEGNRLEAGFHMHLAEHEPEMEEFAKTHKVSSCEFLRDLGILGSRTLVAHTVQLSPEELRILKETGTVNVHNPRSNMGNGVGIADLAANREIRQPVCLGSDGFNDIPDEISLAAGLQSLKTEDPSAFSTADVLKMAYCHGSQLIEKTFGKKTGCIKPGYEADFILKKYDSPTPVTQENLISHVPGILASPELSGSWIGGKRVVGDSRILGIDEEDVFARAREACGDLWKRFKEQD